MGASNDGRGRTLERFVAAGEAAQRAVDKIIATADEIAGMAWWNSLTPAERVRALVDAGYDRNTTPSAADAWAQHKRIAK